MIQHVCESRILKDIVTGMLKPHEEDIQFRVQPGYNNIGLCDTSSTASDILWYQFLAVNRNNILLGYNNTHLQ
jgi:hypothetical protein